MSKPSSPNPSNCVRDLIQQQLAAWEGAEVICIEVPTINLAVVNSVRMTDNFVELDMMIDGATCTISF